MRKFFFRLVAFFGLILAVYRILMLVNRFHPLSDTLIGGFLLLTIAGAICFEIYCKVVKARESKIL